MSYANRGSGTQLKVFEDKAMRHILKPALISVLGGIALSAMIAAPASAGHVCKEYGQMSDALKSLYGERMVSSTQKGTDRRLEFWVSDKGTWSMVLVLPNGRSCLKSSGPHPFTEKLRVAESPALPNAG
ncbi:MAG: hypothetical protein IIB66_05320 [Proteobacteria bacterium]|nr:hypothetical protein [Pseudomonadota bacterium]MCH8188114.1 hypothetical protein [Pseudomonadota bacterium]